MISALAKVLAVTAIAVPVLYLLHSMLAGRLIRPDPYLLLLHMSTAFLVMSILEAGLGFLHTELLGWRLWEYRLLPNHRGYGTYLGLITWPWYGFHLYLFEQALAGRGLRIENVCWRGSLTGVDGPLLEILGNGLFLLMFGQYVFYYFPGDLGHVTSTAVMPHYALAGVVLAVVLRALVRAERSWLLPLAIYFIGACFVAVG